MRKRKERRTPPKPATWHDRTAVIRNVLASALVALKIGEWFRANWPF